MRGTLPDFQIFTFECPYDSLSTPEARSLFGQLMAFKIQGYQETYPYGVLPTDTYDFISTHHLVMTSKSSLPVMAFRTIDLARCDLHGVPFPGLAVLRSSGATEHASILEQWLSSARQHGKRVSYGSGWALNPEYRKDRELKDWFRALFAGMLVSYERSQKTDWLACCGVPKVKTDRFFQSIGYERLKRSDQSELPPFDQASLLGDPAVALISKGFNDNALALESQFQLLWTKRRIIEAPAPAFIKKAA